MIISNLFHVIPSHCRLIVNDYLGQHLALSVQHKFVQSSLDYRNLSGHAILSLYLDLEAVSRLLFSSSCITRSQYHKLYSSFNCVSIGGICLSLLFYLRFQFISISYLCHFPISVRSRCLSYTRLSRSSSVFNITHQFGNLVSDFQ